MCFGGNKTTSSTTTSSSVPQNIQELSDKIAGKTGTMLDSEFAPWKGDRVAGTNKYQNTALYDIYDLATHQPINTATSTAMDYIGRSAGAAPTIGSSNVNDPGSIIDSSRLGSIQDYMDPYVGQVLDPTIARISKAGQQENNRIGQLANMSGAFGDARHGVLESENNRNVNDAISEATAGAYSNAFGNAMSLRGDDLGRMLQTDFYNADSNRARDIFNAQSQASGLDRLYRAGTGIQSAGQTQQTENLNTLAALLGAGGKLQDTQQKQVDADYEEFLRMQQFPFDLLAAGTGAVSGIPYERSQTSTTKQPDNSGYGLVGSLISSLF